MTEPAISVLIPTYQRRQVVRRAVESVLRQTFGDFELIVVDDGSTDGTEAELRGLDPRLRYVWQENRGVSAARNAGIRLAQAAVVAFLDSDDRWLPHHLGTVARVLARHPEVGLVSTCPRLRIGRGSPRVQDLLPRFLIGGGLGPIGCVAVRRSALLEIGGFDERLAVGEDGDLWRRLAVRHRLCLLRAATVEKGHLPDSLSKRGRREGSYLEAERLTLETLLGMIPQARPDDADELLAIVRGRLRLVAAASAMREGDSEAAGAALREAAALAPALARQRWAIHTFVDYVSQDDETRRRHLALVSETWA